MTPLIQRGILDEYDKKFPELGYRYLSALQWDWDDAVFALICVVIVELLWAVYESDTVQEIKFGIDQSVNNPYASGRMGLFLAAFKCFLLCMAVSAAIYFSQRASYMLERHGIAVSDAISLDLLHLQIQFLVASLCLNISSVILLLSVYKYMSYKEYRGGDG